jgi:pumilio homology domain family member 6
MATSTKRKSDKKGPSSVKKSKHESPTNSKGSLKHQRQSSRKHSDVVNDAKRVWNLLRLKTNTTEQNRALMDQLMPLIEGKANEIALQHDAARVVQAAIQFGTMPERQLILIELCAKPGNLAELCKSQYAHFCVLKAIKYCHTDATCVKLMVKGLKGHIAKLAVHAVGSRCVQSLFVTLSPKQTAVLKQEFYGPHFALFASDTMSEQIIPTLVSNLALAPEKREATLDFVRNLVNKCMEKTLYGFAYFQDLLAEYCGVAGSSEIRTMASTAADHAIHLLSARSGTRVVAALIAYGTPKDRKRIMKSLKGYAKSGLLHHDAYLAIIRLVQLTDDTVSIHKNVFNELLAVAEGADQDKSPLLEIALSDTGSKLFLLLLIADKEARRKCFDPYELSVLFPNPTVMEDGHEVSTSKKDLDVRRKELIKYLREPLIHMCCKHAQELLRSRPGALVLREVYVAFRSEDVVEAIVGVCRSALHVDSSEMGHDEEESVPLFEHRDGHLAVKNLILADAYEGVETKLSSAFVDQLQDRLMDVAKSNRGAFVVAALCKVKSLQKKVTAKLNQAALKELAEGEGATAGFKALVKGTVYKSS